MGVEMIKDVYFNKISLETNQIENIKQDNMLLAGAALSISNPYFIIWWSTVGISLIMNSYASFGIIGILLFYIGHILSDISWFTFVSILISKTRSLINIKVYKSIIVILACCLICFGVNFCASSVQYISKF